MNQYQKKINDNFKKSLQSIRDLLNTFDIQQCRDDMERITKIGKEKYNYKLYEQLLKFCEDNPRLNFESALKQINGGM